MCEIACVYLRQIYEFQKTSDFIGVENSFVTDMSDMHAVDLANESHFSWTDCDGFVSSLGGDRYRMRAVLKSE